MRIVVIKSLTVTVSWFFCFTTRCHLDAIDGKVGGRVGGDEEVRQRHRDSQTGSPWAGAASLKQVCIFISNCSIEMK